MASGVLESGRHARSTMRRTTSWGTSRLKLGVERVSPLVRGEMDELSVLVADVAAFQPAGKRVASR